MSFEPLNLHETLVAAVRDAGYTVAVTTLDSPNNPGHEPLLLNRKVIWEGHIRGLTGAFSPSLAAAHLHDLFGALGLIRPVEGRRGAGEGPLLRGMPWRQSA